MHTMKYHFTMKTSGFLIHPTTWVKVRCLMLSQRSQTQVCLLTDSIWHFGNSETMRTENWSVLVKHLSSNLSHMISLSFCFFMCKMGVIIPTSEGVVSTQCQIIWNIWKTAVFKKCSFFSSFPSPAFGILLYWIYSIRSMTKYQLCAGTVLGLGTISE